MSRSPYLINASLWMFLLAIAMLAGLYFRLPPVIAFLIGANFAAFGLFFIDKNSANENIGRVPEVILYVAIWFGMIGGMLGMSVMRHKTRKPGFQLVAMLMLLIQIAFAVFIIRPHVFVPTALVPI